MVPSTLKGPGWRARTASHAEELAQGAVWSGYAVGSEVGRLAAVLLTWPDDGLAFAGLPGDWLMDARPDLARMREEAAAIGTFYESMGVRVHWIRPVGAAPPNLVFVRDLFVMTPEGAVLGRMAAQQRAGEERWAARALADAGVPILATPRGHATLEGADVLWAAPDVVLVGLGNRTDEEGLRTVGRVLADQGVRTLGVRLPARVQHLLGSVNFVSARRCVGFDCTPSIRAALAELDVELLEFPDTDEVVRGRALNFVTLGPDEVVMPAGAPRTRARLEAAGVECHTLEVSQYLRAAGGLGCLTGILARGA